MDNNISDKLGKILSDSDGLEKIMSLAKSLSGGDLSASESSENGEKATKAGSLPIIPTEAAPVLNLLKSLSNSPIGQVFSGGEKERIQLLLALKPYLGNEKREKLSKIISAMESVGSVASLAKLL